MRINTPTIIGAEIDLARHAASALSGWLDTLPASGEYLVFVTELKDNLDRLATALRDARIDMDKADAGAVTLAQFARRPGARADPQPMKRSDDEPVF